MSPFHLSHHLLYFVCFIYYTENPIRFISNNRNGSATACDNNGGKDYHEKAPHERRRCKSTTKATQSSEFQSDEVCAEACSPK